jgi:O-antigen ligase
MIKSKLFYSKYIFYILVLLIPINLGKHFVTGSSYISGILIDYLIPTIYIQDILALLLLTTWLLEDIKSFVLLFKNNRFAQILVLLLFSLFLSVLVSPVFVVSLTYFIRFVLYSSVFLFTYTLYKKESLDVFIKLITLAVLFVSLLGIYQFLYQKAFFNNYLFFGEQPYTVTSRGLTHEYFLGKKIIPSYGLFRHPNTLGGYLSICLLFVLATTNRHAGVFKKLSMLTLILGVLCLLFTFSTFAFISFVLGILGLFVYKFEKHIPVLLIIILLIGFILPVFYLFPLVSSTPSFYRRADLLINSYNFIRNYPLYGAGFGVSTLKFSQLYFMSRDILFMQPVHNIYILLLEEAGIFTLIFYLGLFVLIPLKYKSSLFFIPLVQLVFLGSFDHYFITAHQTLLLSFIFLGLCYVSDFIDTPHKSPLLGELV